MDTSLYYNQVKAYIDAFSAERVKILLNEDLDQDSPKVLRDIFEFLEVGKNFKPGISDRWNTTKTHSLNPVTKFLNDYNHPLKKFLRPITIYILGKRHTENLVNLVKDMNTVGMKSETKAFLKEYYRKDILKLQDLINCDLSTWL